MNVRNEMLVALVKEVLGPREGPYECLPSDHDPFSEYITGVLQPPTESLAGLRLEDRIEDSVDMVIEESSSEEDQHSEGFAVLPGIFSPALDPPFSGAFHWAFFYGGSAGGTDARNRNLRHLGALS